MMRPMQTRGKPRTKCINSDVSDSSVASSGEEYRPETVTRRVRKVGTASQVIKRALVHCGLAQQERIIEKANNKRTPFNYDPLVSFEQDEVEFVACEQDQSFSSGSLHDAIGAPGQDRDPIGDGGAREGNIQL